MFILGQYLTYIFCSLTLAACKFLRVPWQNVVGLVMRNGGQKVEVKHISDVLRENWSAVIVSLKEWVPGERFIQLKKVS